MVRMHGGDQKNSAELKEDIRRWSRELGFDAVGFSGTRVDAAEGAAAAPAKGEKGAPATSKAAAPKAAAPKAAEKGDKQRK